jgi:hypothetical protein
LIDTIQFSKSDQALAEFEQQSGAEAGHLHIVPQQFSVGRHLIDGGDISAPTAPV